MERGWKAALAFCNPTVTYGRRGLEPGWQDHSHCSCSHSSISTAYAVWVVKVLAVDHRPRIGRVRYGRIDGACKLASGTGNDRNGGCHFHLSTLGHRCRPEKT